LAKGGKNKLVMLVSNSSLPIFREKIKDFSSDIILINNLSNAERDALYAGAIALVFPSRCEGFGYPILEAMCQGCPPIAFANSPATEIIGGCIQSLENLQTENIVNLMHAYENYSKNARQKLEASLMVRANSFIEQNNLAQKYIDLLQSLQ
jgi:glycosyltransferase involved in cell wall biosynthesis